MRNSEEGDHLGFSSGWVWPEARSALKLFKNHKLQSPQQPNVAKKLISLRVAEKIKQQIHAKCVPG